MNKRQAKKKKANELDSLYIRRPIASVPRWRMRSKWECWQKRIWLEDLHKFIADPHITYEVVYK